MSSSECVPVIKDSPGSEGCRSEKSRAAQREVTPLTAITHLLLIDGPMTVPRARLVVINPLGSLWNKTSFLGMDFEAQN